jgi:hypothetical protein
VKDEIEVKDECNPGRWEVQLDRLESVTKEEMRRFHGGNCDILHAGRYDSRSVVEWAAEGDAEIAAVESAEAGYIISGATEDALAILEIGDLTELRFVCHRRQPAGYTAAMLRQHQPCVIHMVTTGEDDWEGRILPCRHPRGFRVVVVSLNEVIVVDDEK